MSTIKGQNLRVMVATASGSEKCIAMATSCTFHIGTSLEDSSTKDSTGDWQEQEVTGLNWDAQTDSLVTVDTDAGANTPVDLISLMIAKTKVYLKFDVTNGTNNRTATNSAIKKSGTAYISDVSITAANRQNSTVSVQFQGTGALA